MYLFWSDCSVYDMTYLLGELHYTALQNLQFKFSRAVKVQYGLQDWGTVQSC